MTSPRFDKLEQQLVNPTEKERLEPRSWRKVVMNRAWRILAFVCMRLMVTAAVCLILAAVTVAWRTALRFLADTVALLVMILVGGLIRWTLLAVPVIVALRHRWKTPAVAGHVSHAVSGWSTGVSSFRRVIPLIRVPSF
ncbi:MAG TPA: hypothetical protein PLV57_02975 [Phycisphaerae bacterium]|nr:hypothetical protein [Phycisphaerae bacterium]